MKFSRRGLLCIALIGISYIENTLSWSQSPVSQEMIRSTPPRFFKRLNEALEGLGLDCSTVGPTDGYLELRKRIVSKYPEASDAVLDLIESNPDKYMVILKYLGIPLF